MDTITEALSRDHKRCDQSFADMEAAVSDAHWARGAELFEAFRIALESHIDFEEQSLFPAYEEATGDTAGPTEMMRLEHQDMRSCLDQMAHSVELQDGDEFLGLAETLLILLQQHNIKEEQVLYPTADDVLDRAKCAELLTHLQA